MAHLLHFRKEQRNTHEKNNRNLHVYK
uniref:Uncharacterized protein n=1 Tax=Arundo donax TaxID=35708 RepID=A0A0A8ZTP0_ARUDO